MPDFAPVEVEVRVTAACERAFALFTEQIGEWWPVASNSVFGGTVAFEGDELIERHGDKSAVWAEVTRWEPPSALGLSWHAGHDASHTTDILVLFLSEGDETLIRLTHTGWERLLDGERAAADYGEGWPPVLARFAAMVA
jgi:uncharacterized protein YndB with AHSA1/START domain